MIIVHGWIIQICIVQLKKLKSLQIASYTSYQVTTLSNDTCISITHIIPSTLMIIMLNLTS